MLVLSRKPEEKVVIGGFVTVTVLSMGGGAVKLGFEAPENVVIMRDELLRRSARSPGRSAHARRARSRTAHA